MSDSQMTKQELKQSLAALAPEDADYFYDSDNWESTVRKEDLDIITDDLDDGGIRLVGRFLELPDKWLARVVTERDDNGDAMDSELRWFDTEDEAQKATQYTGDKT